MPDADGRSALPEQEKPMHILDSLSFAPLGQYVTKFTTVVLLIPKLKRPLNVLRRHLSADVGPRATALLSKT
jgi:hypothetical protein